MSRRKFTEDEINYVWGKASIAKGYNPDCYRKDKCGNIIFYGSYGKDTTMGWNVDHSKPLVSGGTYHLNNLQVLQSSQNKSKGSKTPYDYNSELKGMSYKKFNSK